MIKTLVKVFRNDETLQDELNAFLTRWQTKHGETLPIVFITSHTPKLDVRGAILDPYRVAYTFFYKELKICAEQDR